jgi:integrase
MGHWITPITFAKLESAKRATVALLDELADLPTVERWAKTWLRDRRALVQDADNDATRLRLHVYPVIGHMRLDEVRPRHVDDVVQRLKIAGKAPRTRRNVYSVLKALFRDARIADVLQGADPCILTHRQLGKIRDAKSGWRSSAVFTRDELEQLVSDARIPEDRRVVYGLLGIGMLRHGEAAGLRWSKVQKAEPLGRLVVDSSYEKGRTKTEEERWMPLHPLLAALLAEWRLAGWARAMGRPPTAEDFVVPVTPEPQRQGRRREVGSFRDSGYTWKRAQKDLDGLGIRRRRVHDLRRTGISLAQDDGADGSILRWGTHAPPREVFDLYTSLHWTTLCREVAKMRLERGRRAAR